MGWSMDQVQRVVNGPRSMFCIRPTSRDQDGEMAAGRTSQRSTSRILRTNRELGTV